MQKNHQKFALILSHTILVTTLLWLTHNETLDFPIPHTIFIVVMIFLGALYRPRWALWFFIGMIPLETTTLFADILPISMRPYQVIGVILIIATFANFILGRKIAHQPRISYVDIGVAMILVGGGLAGILSSKFGNSSSLVLVLLSYGALYALIRLYITKLIHLRTPLIFFSISVIIICAYGYIQNVLFLSGLEQGTMPGRPNGSFQEADWFGMFIVFAIASCCAIFVWLFEKLRATKNTFSINAVSLSALITMTMCIGVLILTVARSAWIGFAAVVIGAFILLILRDLWKTARALLTLLVASTIVAIAVITTFNLTRFDLSNRATSTGSGLQKITIACDKQHLCGDNDCTIPTEISSMDELALIGCSHINLEEIQQNKDEGLQVTTTKRPDPNIDIRKEIYTESLDTARDHPFVGIGWGNIGGFLGKDASGTTLNSSNIILQVWLGSGILGLIGLFVIIASLIGRGLKITLTENEPIKYAYGIFIVTAGIAIFVPNLFNAGLLLGYIWLYLGISQINLTKTNN
jgi:hypothetical protein